MRAGPSAVRHLREARDIGKEDARLVKILSDRRLRVIAQAIDDHARHHVAQQCFGLGLGKPRQAKGIEDDQEDDRHDRNRGIGIELVEEPGFLDIDRRAGREEIPGSKMAAERHKRDRDRQP